MPRYWYVAGFALAASISIILLVLAIVYNDRAGTVVAAVAFAIAGVPSIAGAIANCFMDEKQIAAEKIKQNEEYKKREEAEEAEEKRKADIAVKAFALGQTPKLEYLNAFYAVQRREIEKAKKAERVERDRVEAERVEAERVEAERVEAERVEAERVEAETTKKE